MVLVLEVARPKNMRRFFFFFAEKIYAPLFIARCATQLLSIFPQNPVDRGVWGWGWHDAKNEG
jgi:hypothetical protein